MQVDWSTNKYGGVDQSPQVVDSLEIGRDPTRRAVVLDLPKGPSSYNCLTKLDQLLNRYTRVDDMYIEPLGPKKSFTGKIFMRLPYTKIVLMEV